MAFVRTLDLSDTLYRLRPRRLTLQTPSGLWALGFFFNIRAGKLLTRSDATGLWIMSINADDNTPLLRSHAVTISTDMLRLHRPAQPLLPPGIFECKGPHDPLARDLGNGTCSIVYTET